MEFGGANGPFPGQFLTRVFLECMITNFKEIRDLIKLVRALLRRRKENSAKINDTKIIFFDKGVLILEPFFWGNVILFHFLQKTASFLSKVTIEVGKIYFFE